ncbi:hypothetical protein MP228_003735 [Amoeboaphelidium protococcarum]|nr:hypothetical protein MP228_003735 [Amoeboaphelidium protococcarum]
MDTELQLTFLLLDSSDNIYMFLNPQQNGSILKASVRKLTSNFTYVYQSTIGNGVTDVLTSGAFTSTGDLIYGGYTRGFFAGTFVGGSSDAICGILQQNGLMGTKKQFGTNYNDKILDIESFDGQYFALAGQHSDSGVVRFVHANLTQIRESYQYGSLNFAYFSAVHATYGYFYLSGSARTYSQSKIYGLLNRYHRGNFSYDDTFERIVSNNNMDVYAPDIFVDEEADILYAAIINVYYGNNYLGIMRLIVSNQTDLDSPIYTNLPSSQAISIQLLRSKNVVITGSGSGSGLTPFYWAENYTYPSAAPLNGPPSLTTTTTSLNTRTSSSTSRITTSIKSSSTSSYSTVVTTSTRTTTTATSTTTIATTTKNSTSTTTATTTTATTSSTTAITSSTTAITSTTTATTSTIMKTIASSTATSSDALIATTSRSTSSIFTTTEILESSATTTSVITSSSRATSSASGTSDQASVLSTNSVGSQSNSKQSSSQTTTSTLHQSQSESSSAPFESTITSIKLISSTASDLMQSQSGSPTSPLISSTDQLTSIVINVTPSVQSGIIITTSSYKLSVVPVDGSSSMALPSSAGYITFNPILQSGSSLSTSVDTRDNGGNNNNNNSLVNQSSPAANFFADTTRIVSLTAGFIILLTIAIVVGFRVVKKRRANARAKLAVIEQSTYESPTVIAAMNATIPLQQTTMTQQYSSYT